jgi:hypothetical protein
MTVSSISAASLSQYVLASSGTSQLQQALQTLQSNITSGDLNGAQSAFEVLQNLNQSLTAASGNNSSNDSRLSNDLTALGSALSSGNLSTAQSAFATVQSDLKGGGTPSEQNEINAASQSAQLVQELLTPLNANNSSSSTSGSSISDETTSVLQRVYGTSSGLNVLA